ncbi:aspartate aminotransferase [Bradyrhizobium sp. Leo121]|nr:aspartate aminotransferase [Bradyrhizobium sp. Leo121]
MHDPARQSASQDRLARLRISGRAGLGGKSVRQADLDLLAKAPAGFLDTTHFDTVRFPPPPWADETFGRAARDGALAYTGYRGHPDVLKNVADSTGKFIGITLRPGENVILTPGTQGGLFASLSALVQEGDRVALMDPDYLFSERIVRFLGAEPGHVPLHLDAGDPHPDFDVLEAEFANRGARLFVFSHPNNPSGAVFSEAVIGRIAELAKRYDVTVLVDELYSRLIHEGSFTHLAAQRGMFERTVTLLGQSKTESLSGYRLGVVVAPEKIATRIEDVLSVTALRAPAYAQHLLTCWLRDDHAWLAERMTAFTALRTLTEQKLRQLPWLKWQPQRGTAYAWVDISALELPGPAVAEALLTEAGALVSPGYQFGPASGGHFRVCYARDETEWSSALDRTVRTLDTLKKRRGAVA